MTKNIDELNAMNAANAERAARPRRAVPVAELFGIECPGLPEMGVFTACAERDREAIPARDPHYVFRDAPETRRVLSALEHPGAPAYLVGPTGCGKTTLIEQACARLNRPVTRVNLDGSLGRGDLVGVWVFKEDQSMSFQHGPVATAIRDGHVLVLDEIDVANPSVLLLLQACLEGRPFKVLETGETFAPHPDFRLFATANTIGRGEDGLLYRAAQAQNFALLDRFRWFLAVGYPGEEEEMRILRARFGEALPESVYKMLVQTAAEIRRAHQGEDCEAPMSTRAVIDVAREMVEFGCTPREAFRYRLLNRLSPQDREVCENLLAPVWGSRLDLGPDEEEAPPAPAPAVTDEACEAPERLSALARSLVAALDERLAREMAEAERRDRANEKGGLGRAVSALCGLFRARSDKDGEKGKTGAAPPPRVPSARNLLRALREYEGQGERLAGMLAAEHEKASREAREAGEENAAKKRADDAGEAAGRLAASMCCPRPKRMTRPNTSACATATPAWATASSACSAASMTRPGWRAWTRGASTAAPCARSKPASSGCSNSGGERPASPTKRR